MSEQQAFKVGDRVRVIKDDLSWFGAEGDVAFYDGGINRYWVLFKAVGGYFRANELEHAEPPAPDALTVARAALERIQATAQQRIDTYYVSRTIEHWQEVQQAASDAIAQIRALHGEG